MKHKVYSTKNEQTLLMDGVMEVVRYNAYDLKYLAPNDFTFNPALGSGQIQIKDIHYVNEERRTTWDFCQLLDKKCLNSSKRRFKDWLELARANGWIKNV